MNFLQIDSKALGKSLALLEVLDHPLRQRILQTVHNRGSLTVTEIYTFLELDQSLISQQLGILREAGFVQTRKEGRFIHYSVNYTRTEWLQERINAFLHPDLETITSLYAAYVRSTLALFQPKVPEDTFIGTDAWLKSFTHKIRQYSTAITKKSNSLLQEVEKNKEVDRERLRAALLQISKEGINAFIERYKL